MKKVLSIFVVLTLLAFPFVSCAGEYGAIAYSKSTRNWGTSWNYNTAQGAINAAIRSCNAGDCRWEVRLQNRCGAYATGTDGSVGRSWGYRTLRGAENRALNECYEAGAIKCKIICSVCTGRAR